MHGPRVSQEAINIALTGTRGNEEVVAVEPDVYLACHDAHALIVLTEWDVFTRLDYTRIYNTMQRPAFVFDGRNVLDHNLLRSIGFTVFGIGKPPPRQDGPTAAESARTQAAEAASRARVKVGAARLEDVVLDGMGSNQGTSSNGSSPMSARRGDATLATAPDNSPRGLVREETLGSMA